jgi:asparagine synthase (glutamine-hydrolysing)
MPGIVGIVGKLRKEDGVRQVRQMLDTLSYEPFYLHGTYADECLGLYIGWTAHPDSFGEHMPVRSSDGKVALFLTGEVFNESRSDASSLLDLYIADTDRFFAQLNGTFSGLIADANAGTVKLFNDRLGYEKIYYCQENEPQAFYFASEAKALLQVLPRTREFDRAGLAEFLRFGCTFEERTLYKGLSRLPPASVWELSSSDSTPRKRSYFSPSDWETDPSLDPATVQKNFLEIFCRILPPYARARRGVALSLTGGWDTRMILAAQRFEPRTLPCYTFAASSEDTVDVTQARKVAAAVDQEYFVLRLQQDFLENFADHAEKTMYVSDGYAGICLTHEIYLNRLARDVSHVRLTGNFASEILRGVSTLKEVPLQQAWYEGALARELQQSREVFRDTIDKSHSARFAVFREIPWKLATSLHLANSQLQVRTPFLDNELLQLACIRPADISRSFVPASLVECLRPALLDIPTDRGESGASSGLAEALRKVWFKGTFKLDYWATEGTPDFLTYPVDYWRVNRFLPVRHKFLNYRQWLRGPLKDYTQDLLTGSDGFAGNLVGPATVRRLLKEHASGARNTLSDITALMNLELINKRLFRQ